MKRKTAEFVCSDQYGHSYTIYETTEYHLTSDALVADDAIPGEKSYETDIGNPCNRVNDDEFIILGPGWTETHVTRKK